MGRRMRRRLTPDDPWAYGVYALILLAGFVFFVLPGLLVERAALDSNADWYQARNDVRTAGIQMLAGFVLVVGSYFTARTLRLNREGHITDRFSKAIEHLGGESQATRLGGIYALERIMRDAPLEQGAILEILAAFIRVESRKRVAGDDSPPAEIAAAIRVIGRRNVHDDPDGLRLNFSRADLSYCSFREGSFTNANFFKANLRGAYMVRGDFSGALFEDADLSEAIVDGADFSGVKATPQTAWPDALAAQDTLHGAHPSTASAHAGA
jgi:pentapeptide repeat protein